MTNEKPLPRFWCYSDDPAEFLKSKELANMPARQREIIRIRIVRWLKAGGKCKYCKASLLLPDFHTNYHYHPDAYSVDHIEARCNVFGTIGRGKGLQSEFNLMISCFACNNIRGAREFDYFVELSVGMTRKQMVSKYIKVEKHQTFNSNQPKFVDERIRMGQAKLANNFDDNWAVDALICDPYPAID